MSWSTTTSPITSAPSMHVILLLLCLQIRDEVLGSPYQPLHSWECFVHLSLVLHVQIIDGELEDETERQSRATLTQAFPFEACPPTTRQTSHSPGLQRLADAVARGRGDMTVAERNSLIKVPPAVSWVVPGWA